MLIFPRILKNEKRNRSETNIIKLVRMKVKQDACVGRQKHMISQKGIVEIFTKTNNGDYLQCVNLYATKYTLK